MTYTVTIETDSKDIWTFIQQFAFTHRNASLVAKMTKDGDEDSISSIAQTPEKKE